MVEPLIALLEEALALHLAGEASEMTVVELFAEQVIVAIVCVLVHHKLALVGLVAVRHSSQSSSSSHACCVSCTAQLSDHDHRSPDKRQPYTVNICIRCLMGANADRVHQGLGVHRVPQESLVPTLSHSLERAVVAVLEVDIAD